MTRNRQRYQHAVNRLETLEPRTLLSAIITSYVAAGVAGNGGVYDSSGNLWVLNDSPSNGFSLDEIGSNHAVADSIPIDGGQFSPNFLAAGPSGLIYMNDSIGTNSFGSIDAIDTVHHTITRVYNGTSQDNDPVNLTVTGDGAVWFVGQGNATVDQGDGVSTPDVTHHTNTIGRLAPGTYALSTFTTGPSVVGPGNFDDATAFPIAPSGADSVWIGFQAAIDQTGIGAGIAFGTTRIGAASFDSSGIHLDAAYAVSDPVASKYDIISSVVNGSSSGTVWFSMANANVGLAPQTAPDQVVEGVVSGSNLTQSAFPIPGSDASISLNVQGLAFDADGSLWFNEGAGPQFGSLSSTGGFLTYASPADTQQQFQTAVNPAGTQLSIINIGSDADAGYPITQIDLPPTVTVTFSGTTHDLSAREDTAINAPLATFVAPTPLSGYTATITWGDSTTSVITLASQSSNTYSLTANGKSFATQGTYNGTITIKDGTTVVGTLTFKSVITDIPLNVTSVTAVPLILRAVTVVGTFTDDSDLALSTWTATINWGDNTTSTAVIVRDPTQAGRYIVLALHQYRTKGTYTVRMTVNTSEQLAAITNNTLTTTVTAR